MRLKNKAPKMNIFQEEKTSNLFQVWIFISRNSPNKCSEMSSRIHSFDEENWLEMHMTKYMAVFIVDLGHGSLVYRKRDNLSAAVGLRIILFYLKKEKSKGAATTLVLDSSKSLWCCSGFGSSNTSRWKCSKFWHELWYFNWITD